MRNEMMASERDLRWTLSSQKVEDCPRPREGEGVLADDPTWRVGGRDAPADGEVAALTRAAELSASLHTALAASLDRADSPGTAAETAEVVLASRPPAGWEGLTYYADGPASVGSRGGSADESSSGSSTSAGASPGGSPGGASPDHHWAPIGRGGACVAWRPIVEDCVLPMR